MSDFKSLGISKELLEALPTLGINTPTPIQEEAIPILNGEPTDFIGLAQTGTGKTAAFGLPALDSVNNEGKLPQVLILAPTRELCQQIASELKNYSKCKKGLKIVSVYGGANIANQIQDLRSKVQIVAATPGRLLDLIRRGNIKLQDVHTVILDEADEMLNMGFIEDIDSILSETPDHRKTWLFSATMPKEIRRLVSKYMTNPQEVQQGTGNEVNENITHEYIFVKASDKLNALTHILDSNPDLRAIVFCRTKRETQKFSDDLQEKGYSVDCLHGDMSQAQRTRVMNAFKAHKRQFIVATDVAARGIDVDDLTHVIHLNVPDENSAYTHRSGRTARAGKTGISLSLVTSRDKAKLKRICKSLKFHLNEAQLPDLNEVLIQQATRYSIQLRDKKVDNVTEELIQASLLELADVSKEELIAKYLELQMGVKIKSLKRKSAGRTERRDDDARYERPEGRKQVRKGKRDRERDRERESRGQSYGNDGKIKYFINVGQIDGMSETELKEIVSEIAHVDKKDLSSVKVLEKHSYFSAPDSSKSLGRYFKGITINNRAIRVNVEDDDRGPKEKKSRSSKPKSKARRNSAPNKNKGRRR